MRTLLQFPFRRVTKAGPGIGFLAALAAITLLQLSSDPYTTSRGSLQTPRSPNRRVPDRFARGRAARPRACHGPLTDIVGSTERAARVGDRRWRELLESHHAAVRSELERYQGRDLDTAGDGFLAIFDGPARAIRAGRAIIDAVGRLGLEVRVGVHSGEVEQLAGGKIGGIAVHVGARVAAAAAPGEVLVSSSVRDLVASSGLSFVDRGRHRLKGLSEERQLFALAA